MGVELPLCVVVTILECCVTFSGVKLSIRSFVLFKVRQQLPRSNARHVNSELVSGTLILTVVSTGQKS